MKQYLKQISPILFILCLSHFIYTPTIAQTKLNLTAGAGYPELASIGIGLQVEQLKMGLSFGIWPDGFSNYSIGGDIDYHFAGKSDYTHLHPWYGRVGLYHTKFENSKSVDKYMHTHLRIGREINFSHNAGMSIGIGAAFELKKEIEEKKPDDPDSWFNWNFNLPSVMPSIGIGFFYRIE